MKQWAQAFYLSQNWKDTSRAYLLTQNNICERCGEPAKICHHKTYLTRESFCITVGGYVAEAAGEIAENLRYYGGYLLAGLAVALAWLLLAVTMPAWYLPYKHFTRKGVKKDEQKAEEKGV